MWKRKYFGLGGGSEQGLGEIYTQKVLLILVLGEKMHAQILDEMYSSYQPVLLPSKLSRGFVWW
jgi:hypothetical protein